MKREFYYIVFNYVHSPILEEKVNVGILFLFPKERELVFKFPKRLHRIKELYKDVEEVQIKNYLRGFERKALSISNKRTDFFSEDFIKNKLNNLVINDFLIEDSTSLQFSSVKKGISNYKSEQIVNQYFNLYFSHYLDDSHLKARHDEEYLNKTLRKKFLSQVSDFSKYITSGFKLEDKDTELKFDYRWQNTQTHLIKTIGFDLVEPSSINDKAVLYYGRLNILSRKAQEKNYNFNLVISKPQDDNKKIKDAYNRALDVLRKTDAPKELILESEIDKYAQETIKTLQSH